MTPAEVIRHLFPSAYWGNPEWQEVKDVLAEEGLVVVSADVGEALKFCGGLLARHSRDWAQDASDALLWAVLCGWECEDDHDHDDICGGSGALHEVAKRFGWDEARVEHIKRLRRAVAALPERTETDG